MPLRWEAYECAADDQYPLVVTAKRYWWEPVGACRPGDSNSSSGPRRVGGGKERSDASDTLVLLHSTSFCKESWEPVLEALFCTLEASGLRLGARSGVEEGTVHVRKGVKVREAWSVDCPNHGEAAVVNEVVLGDPKKGFYNNFTCEKYADAVCRFLTAGVYRLTGDDHALRSGVGENLMVKVDFCSRKLVGIGHSLGGVAISKLHTLLPPSTFRTLVVVEPMLSPDGRERLRDLRVKLVRSAYERRDVWATREEAWEDLKRKVRVRGSGRGLSGDVKGKGTRKAGWDERSLRVYVNHALRPHPGSRDKDTPYNGVTLCLSREAEAAMYKDFHGPTRPVSDLEAACTRIPVHIVLGKVNDFIPREVHAAIVDPRSKRRFASVTWVDGVGHLVPQEVPDELAGIIFKILAKNEKGEVRVRL